MAIMLLRRCQTAIETTRRSLTFNGQQVQISCAPLAAVQLKTVSKRSEKPVGAPLTLSLRSFQNKDFETVPMFFGPLLFKSPAVLTTHFQSLKIICGIETVAKFQK